MNGQLCALLNADWPRRGAKWGSAFLAGWQGVLKLTELGYGTLINTGAYPRGPGKGGSKPLIRSNCRKSGQLNAACRLEHSAFSFYCATSARSIVGLRPY
jgi:hypothetical protein